MISTKNNQTTVASSPLSTGALSLFALTLFRLHKTRNPQQHLRPSTTPLFSHPQISSTNPHMLKFSSNHPYRQTAKTAHKKKQTHPSTSKSRTRSSSSPSKQRNLGNPQGFQIRHKPSEMKFSSVKN